MFYLGSLTGITAIVVMLDTVSMLGCTLMWYQHGGASGSGASSNNTSALSASKTCSAEKKNDLEIIQMAASGDESDKKPPAKPGTPSKCHYVVPYGYKQGMI